MDVRASGGRFHSEEQQNKAHIFFFTFCDRSLKHCALRNVACSPQLTHITSSEVLCVASAEPLRSRGEDRERTGPAPFCGPSQVTFTRREGLGFGPDCLVCLVNCSAGYRLRHCHFDWPVPAQHYLCSTHQFIQYPSFYPRQLQLAVNSC